MTKAPAADANRFQTSTIHNGQRVFKRHTHRYEAEVLDEHRLEEWKPVKGKVRNMLEATLLDVKRMEVDERGQIHHHQLLKVSCSLRNCQGFNCGGSVIQRGKGKRGLAVAQRSSLLEYRRQNSRVLRYQLGHVTE